MRLRHQLSRFLALWNGKRRRADLEAELRFHLETESEERQDAGASPADARRAARVDFGNPAIVAEDARAVWSWTPAEQFIRDVRYAFRTLAKSRVFTASAVICLALGIGANTVLYGLTDAVLLRTLPVPEPHRLVRMTWRTPVSEMHGTSRHDSGFADPGAGFTRGVFSHAAFELFASRDDLFSSVFAYQRTRSTSLTIGDQTTLAMGEYVSAGYFDGLGVAPAAGRLLSPDDDRPGARPVAVIASALAERWYGEAAKAVGSTVLVNSTPVAVVGVAPRGFFGTDPAVSPDLYLPLHATLVIEPATNPEARSVRFEDSAEAWLEVMGRLRPGVTLDDARAALAAPFQQFSERVRDTGTRWEQAPALSLIPGAQGIDGLRRGYATPLLLLMGMAAVILLLSCANIANLLLARSTARGREIAIRLSLGAAHGRVVRQLLTESVVLSSVGGLLGVGLAAVSQPLVTAMLMDGAPGLSVHVGPPWRMLIFSGGLTLLTGLIFGSAPAIRSIRTAALPRSSDSRSTPATASGRGGPARALLVMQVGATLVLLVFSGLFARTLASYAALDLGFDPDRTLTVTLNARQAGLDSAGALTVYDDIRNRLAALPGVESVGMSDRALLGDGRAFATIVPAGRDQVESSPVLHVGAGFFAATGAQLLRGRPIGDGTQGDRAAPVVVISDAYARSVFGDQDPIGRFVRIPDESSRVARVNFEIVGVVRDLRYGDISEAHPPVVFVPFDQAIFGDVQQVVYVVRTTTDPMSQERLVRQVVREASPRIPIARITTQSGLINQLIATPVLLTRLCVAFATLALFISVVGLYGSVAYDVSRRAPEIGVRLALGARPWRIVRLVVGNLAWIAAAGVGLGLPAVLFLTRFAETYLFGVTARDPVTLAAATGVLVATALLASYVPARAAARADLPSILRRG